MDRATSRACVPSCKSRSIRRSSASWAAITPARVSASSSTRSVSSAFGDGLRRAVDQRASRSASRPISGRTSARRRSSPHHTPSTGSPTSHSGTASSPSSPYAHWASIHRRSRNVPGSRTAATNRSRSGLPSSGRYASEISRPLHSATCRRLAPAIRRTSSTTSGSIQAPTTNSVPMVAISSTVTKRYVPRVMATPLASRTVARVACRTVVPMLTRLAPDSGRRGRAGCRVDGVADYTISRLRSRPGTPCPGRS